MGEKPKAGIDPDKGSGGKKKRRRTDPITDPDDPRRRGLSNLRPAKPGEVRNPTGKNGSEWLKAFRRFWESMPVPGEPLPAGAVVPEEGESRYDVALRALFRNVAMGSDASIKLAFEQLQGRARQHIELSGDVGNGPPVQFMLPPNGRDVAQAPPAPVEQEDNDPPPPDESEEPGDPPE